MDTPSILGLAGGSLARRMLTADDDAPTLTMPTVGDNPSVLPWQTDYRVERSIPGIGFVYASVMRAADLDEKPWSAYVTVDAGESFKGWFESAEAARAAVEEHIAAHLKEHEHQWIDITPVESVDRRFLCADCGKLKEEPR